MLWFLCSTLHLTAQHFHPGWFFICLNIFRISCTEDQLLPNYFCYCIWTCFCLHLFSFFKIKFIGLALVNKMIQVASVQFRTTSSACCSVCSPPKWTLLPSPHIWPHSRLLPPQPPLSLWSPPCCCLCRWGLVCRVCSFAAFSFTSDLWVRS